MTLQEHKKSAKQAYLKRARLLEGVDCGVNLLREISPDFRKADDDFQYHFEVCQKLDPNCPKTAERG